MITIKNIEVSEAQAVVIDALLSTHRELVATDLVDYNISSLAMGGKVLKIKTGEYWYYYKILKNGSITESRKSMDNIRYTPLKYFTV